MKLFDFFKRKQKETNMRRSFIAAQPSRFTSWLASSLTPITYDTRSDLLKLVLKSRQLAKNNALVGAFLETMHSSVIGKAGFSLQTQTKSKDGTLNDAFNNEIEQLWYDFGKVSNHTLTTDGGLGHNDLDKLILRNILIDGEAFVRVRKSSKLPYGVQFQLIDGMQIDTTKFREFSKGQNAIVCRC